MSALFSITYMIREDYDARNVSDLMDATWARGLPPITRVIGGICHLKNPQAPDVDISPWVEGLAQISWKLS
jgi:hypothetical protein